MISKKLLEFSLSELPEHYANRKQLDRAWKEIGASFTCGARRRMVSERFHVLRKDTDLGRWLRGRKYRLYCNRKAGVRGIFTLPEYYLTIRFYCPQDAMWFKLTWGGV